MTLLSLRLITVITRIFGTDDMPEKQIMRLTIYVFLASACIRLVDLVVANIESEKILQLYRVPALFNLFLITCWLVTDLMPILFLYKVHFQNFISFEGQEIVHTDY